MEEIGYFALFLYSLGGGYVGIVTAGIMSYAGSLDITLSIIIATAGNFIGDTLLFYMMRYNKTEMMDYLRKHRRKLALAHIMIKRYGDKIVFIQKYIYGVKTLVPMAIGLTKYPFDRFTLYNAIASMIWGVTVGLAAFYLGAVLMPVIAYFSDHFYLAVMIVFTMLGGLYYYMHRVTAK